MAGSTAVGLLACAVASVFFGSAYVPIKHHDAGDGLFVQWVMAIGIWHLGLVVYAFTGFPTFHPLAMLGGAFWALGNLTAVPIMSQLGVGLGMLVWGTTNVITGWACGTFGLFGTNADPPSSALLNGIGLASVICGGILFSQVRASPRNAVSQGSLTSESEIAPASTGSRDEGEEDGRLPNGDAVVDETERLLSHSSEDGTRKRIMAFAVALVAGVFYGVTFMPVVYIEDHPEKFHDASPEGLPYVFSHYTGILLTATVLFVGYLALTMNRPRINPQIVAPSLAGGAMWGIAQAAWFVANENLSQAVSFPIIGMVPGVLSALWSVLYFKEIRGARNLRILMAAMTCTGIGAVLVGLSK